MNFSGGCSCWGTLVFGMAIPLLICLFIYLLILIYVAYQTYNRDTIDIRQWRRNQLELIEMRQDTDLKTIEQEIIRFEEA